MDVLEREAEKRLLGVGDATLGEWRARGDLAFHIRRRLTAKEMHGGGILGVVDIRGTDEHRHRIEQIRPYLPAPYASQSWQTYP